MNSNNINDQIEQLFTMTEVIELYEKKKAKFEEFKSSTIQLVKRLAQPECNIFNTYEWLLKKILENCLCKRGLILGIYKNHLNVKVALGFGHDITDDQVQSLLGEALKLKISENNSLIIIDDLQKNESYLDCKLELSNLLAFTILSNGMDSEFMIGSSILIGNKEGRFNVDDVEMVKTLYELAADQLRLAELTDEKLQKEKLNEIIGNGKAVTELKTRISKIAKHDTSVLILGETGTGKELVATAIHKASQRTEKPFITINCPAFAVNLEESELFGIEQNVATGVKKRIGLFEQANNGTIFFDEIGDMPINLQAKILRTLEERTIRRVGGNKEIKINVRILAATHKNLLQEIKAGNFREDLYFRLNIINIYVPPLKQRKEDIPILVNHFLKRSGRNNLLLNDHSLDILKKYHWPGNIRELITVIQRIVVLYDGSGIVSSSFIEDQLTNTETPSRREINVNQQDGSAFGLDKKLHQVLVMKNIPDEKVIALAKHLDEKRVITRKQIMEIMEWPQDKRSFQGKAERILNALKTANITTLQGKKHVYSL